jgi:HEAT repeat protein
MRLIVILAALGWCATSADPPRPKLTEEQKAVRRLAADLKSDEVLTRRTAATELGKLGSAAKPAAPALVAALQDKDLGVRTNAVLALGEVGADPAEAVGPMLDALKDQPDVVRNLALKPLRKMGPAVFGLLDKTTGEYAERLLAHLRADAVASLESDEGTIGYLLSRENVSRDQEERIKEAVARLIEGLKHPDPAIRNAAEVTLARTKWGTRSGRTRVYVAALKDSDAGLRARAAGWLGEYHNTSREALPDLRDALKDSDPGVRLQVVGALGQFGSVASDALPDLIALRKKDRSTKLKVTIDSAIERIDPATYQTLPKD